MQLVRARSRDGGVAFLLQPERFDTGARSADT